MINHDQMRTWLAETGKPSHIVVGAGHDVHLLSCGIDHADSGKPMFAYSPDGGACLVANLSCHCGHIRRMPVLRPVDDAVGLLNEVINATSTEHARPAPVRAPVRAPVPAPVPPLRAADTRTRTAHRPAPARTRPGPPPPAPARPLPRAEKQTTARPLPALQPVSAPAAPAPAPIAATKPFDVSDNRHLPVPTYAAQRAADRRATPRGVCPHCGSQELLRTDNTMMRHKLGLRLCPGVYQPTANLIQE